MELNIYELALLLEIEDLEKKLETSENRVSELEEKVMNLTNELSKVVSV